MVHILEALCMSAEGKSVLVQHQVVMELQRLVTENNSLEESERQHLLVALQSVIQQLGECYCQQINQWR